MSDTTFVTLAYVELYRDMGTLRWRGTRIQYSIRSALQNARYTAAEKDAFKTMYRETQVMMQAARAVQTILENLWEVDATPERSAEFQYSPNNCVSYTLKRIDTTGLHVQHRRDDCTNDYVMFKQRHLPEVLKRFSEFAAKQYLSLSKLIDMSWATIERKGEDACTKSTSLTA